MVRELLGLRLRVVRWMVRRPAWLRLPLWLGAHLMLAALYPIVVPPVIVVLILHAGLVDLWPLLDAPQGPRVPPLPSLRALEHAAGEKDD